MKTRLAIAAVIFMLVQAVLFGIGAIVVLATPLKDQATTLIPFMIAVTIVLAAPFSWWLAPRLRTRYWRKAQKSVADRTISALS